MVEIIRKRGIEKVKLVHNKKLFWIIIILGIILIAIIIFIVANGKGNNPQYNISDKECQQDSDCVPVCGCHPSSCIAKDKRAECERVFCTQECSGPLDCGAGSCGCVNGKCDIISNNNNK